MGEHRGVSDARRPAESIIELVVYAPVGVVVSLGELVGRLADRGRQQVSGQVAVARAIGQFAVTQGRSELEKVAGQAWEQLRVVLDRLGAHPPDGAGPPASNGSRPDGATAAPSPAARASGPTSGPDAAALAIPDYDSLSASQVLPRLSGLSPSELEAVRSYEAAHRGRRTILNKIDQLQSR